uniref:Uncharacterized protein n=1 Tax=Rhizophora mucronata TaxID=61149 RepID=A0A2P2LDW4_RHIMU
MGGVSSRNSLDRNGHALCYDKASGGGGGGGGSEVKGSSGLARLPQEKVEKQPKGPLSFPLADKVPDDDDDDDGSGSVASSATAGSEGEDVDHHLLTTPNGDVAFLKEKPVRLARELV